jgi:hypothetical protein
MSCGRWKEGEEGRVGKEKVGSTAGGTGSRNVLNPALLAACQRAVTSFTLANNSNLIHSASEPDSWVSEYMVKFQFSSYVGIASSQNVYSNQKGKAIMVVFEKYERKKKSWW